MKKVLFMFLVIVLLTINVKAYNYVDIDIKSKNALLYNVTDDIVMYEKNSNDKVKIASLTKVMTALVALENIASLDEYVTINEDDYYNVYKENLTVLGFGVGDRVTYRDLLYGLLFKSGADCAYALANNIAGSNENFVKLMNSKAKELNLNNTYFTNPVGYDEDNYSTALDVVKLYNYAIKNESFRNIINSEVYTTSNNQFTLYNVIDESEVSASINSSYQDYILGGKTGYTKLAQNCLVSNASYNNTDYILVTINAKSKYHMIDTMNIYENVFKNFKRVTIYKKGDYLTDIKSPNGKFKYYAKDDISILTNKNIDSKKIKVSFDGKIDKNTKKGDNIGKIIFKYDDYVVKRIDATYDGINIKNKHLSKDESVVNKNIALFLTSALVLLFVLGIVMFFNILVNRKNN